MERQSCLLPYNAHSNTGLRRYVYQFNYITIQTLLKVACKVMTLIPLPYWCCSRIQEICAKFTRARMLSQDSVGYNELEIFSGCQSSWSGWKWNGATLSVNIFNTLIQDGGHKVGIKLHKVNYLTHTCDYCFPCSWGKDSHVWQSWTLVIISHGPLSSSGWMSLLTGPRLPLNQNTSPFHFTLGVDQIQRCIHLFTNRKNWKMERAWDHWALRTTSTSQVLSWPTSHNVSFF